MENQQVITELPRQYMIVDGHCDTIADYLLGYRDLTVRGLEGHVDLPRLRAGGVAVQFFACFVESKYKPAHVLERGLQLVEACRRLIDNNPNALTLLTGVDDIPKAAQRTAVLISIEGGEILNGQAFMLSLLYRLGVRAMGLTWNYANALAGGVAEPGRLTAFGKQVVKEMNRLGMLVDVSHLSDPAFWDVVKVTEQPVIASHSCCRTLCAHPRNLTDQQIRAIAETGGVIGINFYTEFVTGGEAGLADVIRHIDHICTLVGPDYVGIGSDFDGCLTVPKGLEDVTCLPALADTLLATGYKGEEVAKIMGGNFIRVIRKVIG
ncbi:MAG TPA: dipeptidase [Desulfobacteria bacterium]|nr:dipeptidase [Desulfobacteria bacterium]